MIGWLSIGALAGAPLDDLPAQLAGIGTWEQRLAAVGAATEGLTSAEDLERAAWAAKVLALLAEREPDAARARVREVAFAALSHQARVREEALKAAQLGLALPAMPVRDGWFERLPLPPVEGQRALSVRAELAGWDGDAAAVTDALSALLGTAGWPVGEGVALAATLEPPYPARWGDQAGYAVTVHWALEGSRRWDTQGFRAGPLNPDATIELVGPALHNLLAERALVDTLAGEVTPAGDDATQSAELEPVEVGRLCWYRLAHNDRTPLGITIGGRSGSVAVGTFACGDLPEGMVLSATANGGSATASAAAPVVVQVDFGTGLSGSSKLVPSDQATLDKLVAKRKVTEAPLVPGP